MKRGKSTPVKARTILISILACGALCLAGIGYIWAKSQVWGLSREMKTLETRLEELKRRNNALQRTYAAMCTPHELDARVKRLNLGLAAPQPDQIVRMPEPSAAPVAQAQTRNYAAGGAD